MATWKCEKCGETVEGRCRPAVCPKCGASKDDFKKVEESGCSSCGCGCGK